MTLLPDRLRIFVVEDERLAAADVCRLLERAGYEVAGVAADCGQALAALESARADAVLMDITLPGPMDGVDGARAVAERFALPVVFLSAREDQATLARAGASGSMGYLLKPVQPAELRAALETARHKHELERKLRASEARYRSLVELLGEGVVRRDARGAVSFANGAFCEILGRDMDTLLGTRLESYVAKGQEALVREQLERRARGERGRYELRFVRPDGSERITRVSATPVEEHGRFAGSLMAVTDVTEETSIRKARQEAQSLYRSMFENAAVGMYRAEASGRLLAVNRALSDMLGYDSPGQMVEMVTRMDLQVYADPARHARLRELIETEGAVHRFESEVYGRDGDLIVVSESARRAQTPGGGEVVESVVSDVTEAREAREAFQATFELLQRTIDAISDLVTLTDLSGVVILANRAMREFFDLSDDPAGTDYHALMYEAGHVDRAGAALAAGEGTDAAFIHLPDKGATLHETASPFAGLDGEVIGKVCVARILTREDATGRAAG